MTIPRNNRYGNFNLQNSDQYHLSSLKVERPHYEQEQLNNELNYTKPKINVIKETLMKCKNFDISLCCKNTFPVIKMLSEYSWKNDFIGDLISGCTVAVMHIPQGMGYALLANVPPIVGIYMAFFPVLLYFIFGTSKHNSMGTFAVISIMVGKTVLKYSDQTGIEKNETSPHIVEVSELGRTPMQIATAVCFIVGVIQLLMYICRLGIISTLLSETLVSGFTTGAAIHVLTSQIKDLIGLTLPPTTGSFEVYHTYYEIFTRIFDINLVATLITAITITLLVVNNEWLKPKLAKKTMIPFPIELIVVVGGTLIARLINLEEKWNINAIGNIPIGFPDATVPDLSLFKELLGDSFTIAVVSYTVSVSMALIFAQKGNYEVDFNQELLAMGAGNVFSSFFYCIPFSASLSRSTIQITVGGKTQIASIVSCALLSIVLLWVGPFFEPLPKCILASIIVVALKGMLMQVTQFFSFLKLSSLDALVWIITFLTVVIVSIDIGLLVGILLSISCIFIRGMKAYTCLLGNVPKTDLYLDINRYKGVEEIPNIKIFHYCGSLNFASRNSFKSDLCSLLLLDIAKETKNMLKAEKKDKKYSLELKCLIIDFSALSYIDVSGTTSLKLLINDINKLSIIVCLAGSSCPVYEMMKKCDLIEKSNGMFKIFPTINDAVHFAMEIIRPIDIISIRL